MSARDSQAGRPSWSLSPQDLTVSYGQAQFMSSTGEPNASGWFGPLTPLAPIAPKEVAGRQFDFPSGYNIAVSPRAFEPITFHDLRALAETYDLLRLVIETRKDQIERMSWSLRPRPGTDGPGAQRIRELTRFFHKPDGEHSFASWLRMLLEDLFVIDAPAGGHVGWNYQFLGLSHVVAGLETDALVFAGSGGHTSTFVTPGGLNPSVAQLGRAMPWAGSTRARIGLLITPALLVYGTGGVAYGAANVNEYAYGSALAATYAPGAQGRIYGGWAAGGGLEWAFLPNWSARVEYLHADLGTHAASFPGFAYGTVPSFPVPQQFLAEVPMRANVVKLGVSYHFNGLLTGDPAKDFAALPSL